MTRSPSIVWFRQDLRLSDNPALAAALALGVPVVPVFIWAPEEEDSWRLGGASKWWLNHSLAALSAELEARGSRLTIRRGPTIKAFTELLEETGAGAVFWNRRYEPMALERDGKLKSILQKRGVTAVSFNGSLLFEPEQIQSASGKHFLVFTAFWRACLSQSIAPPSKNAPSRLVSPVSWPRSIDLPELGLAPTTNWADGLAETWQPGESGAKRQMEQFREDALEDYAAGRDLPGVAGTSRLSPHLHFGEISPGQVWRAVLGMKKNGVAGSRVTSDAYLRQIGWREFAQHLLYHHPESLEQPLRREFVAFPWRTDTRTLRAWTQGKTGYPLVDAGMRELRHTRWMHNRVRMVAASFLVKHLLIGWQEGAAWFWDTLVDADLANNTLGWQWVAGCGADAAPYFRIFNPVIQGEKVDPTGTYVRRWVPELKDLPNEWLHKPWKAPLSVLAEAKVELGRTYPRPIIDHAEARKRALASLASIRGRKAGG